MSNVQITRGETTVTVTLNEQQATWLGQIIGASVDEPDGLYDIYVSLRAAFPTVTPSPFRLIRKAS